MFCFPSWIVGILLYHSGIDCSSQECSGSGFWFRHASVSHDQLSRPLANQCKIRLYNKKFAIVMVVQSNQFWNLAQVAQCEWNILALKYLQPGLYHVLVGVYVR